MKFLRNEKGQMAIFIALFFQVLFVFFAMAINVGLVVHDKINLQNAVDLAAYYGAARQAEILNQIGHINYQMRQNYKLLVWRYRVLSTIGLDAHPLNSTNPASTMLNEGVDMTNVVPAVSCVSHYYWQEYNSLDPGANLCRNAVTNIPNIAPASGGSGFVPGYSNLVTFTQMANNNLQQLCLESGIMNWMFAARMLTHFRIDGVVRKNKIRRLASQLSQGLDLRNESIEDGVRETFDNNLTNGNYSSVQEFNYYNSMSGGTCAVQENWLPEIKIRPIMMFTDFEIEGSRNDCNSGIASGSSNVIGIPNRPLNNGRSPSPEGLNNLPRGFNNAALAATYNTATINTLKQHWAGEPDANNELHSSVGFEKNPWCMVYSGVRAVTVVRKPFSPLSSGVRLEARGYAKPFGGRIGPWYGRTWAPGSFYSQASNRQQMVDPLLPSREIAGGGGFSADPNEDQANYSRFPGDTLGLKSARAITSMISSWKNGNGQMPRILAQPTSPVSPLAWSTYTHLGGRPSLQTTGDSLARDMPSGPAAKEAIQRNYELAAVAPDTFDALYYSIEPDYFSNYFNPNTTNNGAVFSDEEKIYDFGSVKDGYQSRNQPLNERRNIVQAVETANGAYDQGNGYIINNWHHLLTSWHQRGAVDFQIDSGKFGACALEVTNPQYPTYGNCIQGGRTGYSIKNISRDYLLSEEHSLSGAAGSAGAILNPPTF